MELASPAVITMELQRGVCGDESRLAALRDAVVERDVATHAGRLVAAARAAGVPVIHCIFTLRADRVGSDLRLPVMRAARDDPGYLLQGSTAAMLLPELGPEPGDVIVERHHGVSPFGGTTLDEELRSRAIRAVIVAGVSLNVGIPGTVIEAVNAGYQPVVASDAVVGVPVSYGDDVLRNTLAPIARVTDVETIITALRSS